MAKDRNKIIQLGIFVVVATALFIAGSYFIGNNSNLFQPTIRISSIFPNVNGLQPGNNVRFGGIKVGTVDRIEILSDSTLQVHMVLQEDVKPFIKKNAVTSIASDGLVGSMVLNISPGKEEAEPVSEGDVLQSYSRLKADDIINTLGKTNENLALLSNDLLTITEKINSGKGTIGMMLQDTLLANNLRESVVNLRLTTANLNASSRQLHSIVSRVESGEGLLGDLLQDTVVFEKVGKIVSDVDTLLFVQLDSLIKGLRESGDNINTVTAELQNFSQGLNQDEGLLHTMLRDTSTARDLQEILENVNQGTERFSENMEALRHNFLFRGYFKRVENERKLQEEENAREAAEKEAAKNGGN